MATGKRFYWLKLKEDFFDEDPISWIEEQENGKEYCLFYLKLCLKSLKTDGVLMRTVGDIFVPYDIKKLAEITRTDIDTAMVAMQLFEKIGLVQILENGEFYVSLLSQMVGSETDYAEKKRGQRLQNSKKNLIGSGDNVPDKGGDNVPKNVPTEYRDKEYRELEIESNTQEKENIKEKEVHEAESSGEERGQESDTDFVAQVIAHLNEVSGSSFRAQTESTRKAILARRGEGYGLEDFRSVIDDRWAQWKGSDMEQYMRPDTLFRPSKFESYLSEAKKHAKASGRSPYNPERSVGLSDLVEYPPCSGRYRPWWEVPEKERAQYERN